MNKNRARRILRLLKKRYPSAKIILNFSNNFELLVSVMLSAQTTDVAVNKVTSRLFPKYNTSRSKIEEIKNFVGADLRQLENDIKQIGLYKTKARNIKTAAAMILDKFSGKVPQTMSQLLSLPGVGRKTANVVLGNAFGIVEGIAVDTHVSRLSQKYGFSKEKTAEKIEKDLMKLFDKKDWYILTYLLIEHGRNIRKIKKDFIEEIA